MAGMDNQLSKHIAVKEKGSNAQSLCELSSPRGCGVSKERKSQRRAWAFDSPSSLLAIFFLFVTMVLPGSYSQAQLSGISGQAEHDVAVKMRDGTILYADIYRPTASGRFPVLLSRTPYVKDGGWYADFANKAVQRGYCVVIQNTRGRYKSGGEFYPFRDESSDGYDTVEWAAEQPWSNGKVGMFAMSYIGVTQWLAAAANPPHLVAIFPALTASDYHDGWVYRGGALELAFMESWIMGAFVPDLLGKAFFDPTLPNLNLWYEFLPLKKFSAQRQFFVPKNVIPFFDDFLHHPNDGPYWQRWNIAMQHANISVPAYNLGGWYDLFLTGTIKNFIGMRRNGKTAQARHGQKLLIGPWVHSVPTPENTSAGQANFGSNAGLDYDRLQFQWFDYWLRGVANGIMDEPPVRIFVMGRNEWRYEDEWPLVGTNYTKYYLHGSGVPNKPLGARTLSTEPPGPERPTDYIYDPANPVLSRGGAGCGNYSTAPGAGCLGVQDQRPNESREDVLVFASEPLVREMEITGPVTVSLYAASSAADTDFTAKFIDVHPDGYAQNLCDGIIRGRFRDSQANPTLLEPGKIYRFSIDLGATSNVFKVSHRVRVDISSSDFPRFDRNLNTGEPFGEGARMERARNTVFHDAEHPSHIILPVVTRGQ